MPAVAPSGVGSERVLPRPRRSSSTRSALRCAPSTRRSSTPGLLLQVDDPFLCDIFADPELDAAATEASAPTMYVEAVNESLRGIPPEKVRFHTCYGINEGPAHPRGGARGRRRPHAARSTPAPTASRPPTRATSTSITCGRRSSCPTGKVLIPGVITHASNIVEHPELIAERLVRFAKLVGRENVIAGADCGFSSQASYHTEVHPDGGVGEVRGDARRRAAGDEAVVVLGEADDENRIDVRALPRCSPCARTRTRRPSRRGRCASSPSPRPARWATSFRAWSARNSRRACGQPVVVENRPGGSGLVGATAGAHARARRLQPAASRPPGTMIVNTFVYSKMPFDSMKDFEPVALVASVPLVLVVNAASQVKDLQGPDGPGQVAVRVR